MPTQPDLTVEIDFTGHPTADYDDILTNAYGVVSFWRCNSASTFLDSVGSDLALAFDGSADGATVTSATSLSQVGDFTLEAWVKLPSYPAATRDLITKRGAWLLQVTSAGKLVFTVKDDTSTASLTSTGPLAVSTYYHVACVYDSTNIYLYLNGLLDTSTAYTAGRESNSQPLRFAITPSTTAPTYQTNTTANGATGTVTINKPSGTASGDLLVAHIAHHANDNLDTSSLPTDWVIWLHNTTDESDGLETWIFSKVAGGSEPASYTWTITGASITWTGAISRISGVGSPSLANPVWFDSKASGFPSLSTVTHLPNLDNCMVLGLFSQQGTTAFSEDSGTEQYDAGTNFRVALCSQTQTTATSIQITGSISPADAICAVMIILAGT